MESELAMWQDECRKAKSEAESVNQKLKYANVEQERLQEQLTELKDECEGKQVEDDKIRDQYALALKNSNDQLEEAQKHIVELEDVRSKNEQLTAELSALREEYDSLSAKCKQVE
ncbi:unnamed protein product [Anisakis simplex]|uniref:Myosin_tail_1 domain-containing protein n=1 Tax=Anisakis simplex TaxID=6269 RepID=A0A0M3JNI5_ANISI|nr:unnamed protein product [Anisakis simplex]